MNLLFPEYDPTENLLPADGELFYYGSILDQQSADHYLKSLTENIEWKNDEAVVFGKRIVTSRKTAWYGDHQFSYTYSGIARTALPWTKELQKLKTLTEKISGDSFNSCLMNLYHDGNEGVGWHSDAEKMLKPEGTVASLSFGAERVFKFKHKTKDLQFSLSLAHGSLLLMKGKIQQYWLHTLPKSKKITRPRINLTFRTIVGN